MAKKRHSGQGGGGCSSGVGTGRRDDRRYDSRSRSRLRCGGNEDWPPRATGRRPSCRRRRKAFAVYDSRERRSGGPHGGVHRLRDSREVRGGRAHRFADAHAVRTRDGGGGGCDGCREPPWRPPLPQRRSRSRSRRGGASLPTPPPPLRLPPPRPPPPPQRAPSMSAWSQDRIVQVKQKDGFACQGSSSGTSATERKAPTCARNGDRTGCASRSGTGSGSMSGSNSDDDEIIHFSWRKGMVMNSKYHLAKLLGDGTFGRVVLAHDQCSDRQVAIKIIRDVKRYMDNAKIEADILKDIRQADPDGTSGCAIMYETFTHEQRFYCLVFEPLGASLYDFLKGNCFRGFWMQDIQSFAQQCMQALMFLHGHLRMTHTDLKPENILLQSMEPPYVDHFPREAEWLRRNGPSSPSKGQAAGDYLRPASSRIKLIDFGNATYEDEHHSSIINTRQYRGPEVLLGLGWDERSDLWSIGCILMELYAGEQLFATHEELEHLALMVQVIGAIPAGMLEGTSQAVRDSYLIQDPHTGHWRLPWPERASSPSSERHVYIQRPLLEQVLPEHVVFAEFCRELLALDPRRRPAAVDALRHEFLSAHFRE
uniref:Protein kinase domain-containing protein n=1 Tax=Alexandrium monilatum TaxID=311494 RepID=A0A7S4SLT8_9DINO